MRTTLILNKKRILTLDDLRENFNSAEFFAYMKSGRINRWLNDLGESVLAQKIATINPDDKSSVIKIMELLSISEDKCVVQGKQSPEEEKSVESKHDISAEAEKDIFANNDSPQGLPNDFCGIRLSPTCFIDMVNIHAGSFKMGSSHRKFNVTFSRDFYVSKVCITQRQWNAAHKINEDECINLPNYSIDYAIIFKNWFEANEFCDILNKNKSQYGIPNNYVFSLPTDWEWEYFARAGNNSDEYLQDPVPGLHWMSAKWTDGEGHRGLRNQWGIIDIGVNGEWCSTSAYKYDWKDVIDPSDASMTSKNVKRICRMEQCLRYWKKWVIDPNESSCFRSFRIVLRQVAVRNIPSDMHE